MTDVLGSARLELAIDTSTFDTLVAASQNKMARFGTEAEAAYNKSDTAAKKATTSLAKFVENQGRSVEQQKFVNAAIAGVPLDTLKTLANQYNKVAFEAKQAAAAGQQANDFKLAAQKAAENDQLREQQRVVAALTAQFHALEAAEQQQAEFSLAATKAAENDRLREQQRVVAALTAQFHALEAAEAVTADNNRFVAGLQKQSAAIGKTRADLLEMEAAERGVTAAAAPFIAKLREQEGALVKSGIAFNQYGLSAKQTQAALRQVPAQLTDIIVSLQGGQAPLTVLLQQGGQLKDVFGGVVPAARALGGALLGLINPYTILAAAIGSLIYLQVKAEAQQNALNSALISSGNLGDQTAESVNKIADSLDNLSGVTKNAALDALTQIIATGQIAADQQELVATAALRANVATGAAVKDTIAQYVALGKDPVEAILRVNETQNFLTESVYRQIKALQDNGDAAGAAALAIETAANDQIKKAEEIEASLGLITGAWHEIKTSSGEAYDGAISFFNYIDKAAGDSYKSLSATARGFITLAATALNPSAGAIAGSFNAAASKRPPIEIYTGEDQAETSKQLRLKQKARDDLLAIERQSYSDQVKQLGEEQRINALATQAGYTQLEREQALAASRQKFKEDQARKNKQKVKSTSGIDNATTSAGLQDFKDALTKEKVLLDNSGKELKAQYDAKLISTQDYYARTKQIIQQGGAAEEKSLQGQIDFLKSRNLAGKDGINVQKQIGELEAQLAKVRADTASATAILGTEENKVYAQRALAITGYKQALDLQNQALADSVNAQIESIGAGDQEFAQKQKLAAIYRENAKELTNLALALAKGEIDPDTYAKEVQIRQQATDDTVQITVDGYARMLDAQADYLNGVKGGIANWIEQTSNVAQQVEALTRSSLDKASEGLAQFALTGKLSIKSLLADILTEVTKFLAKQAILKFAQLFLNAYLNSGGSGQYSDTAGFGASDGSFAKGATFDNSPSLSAYSGTVVSKPTPFYFARGAGVMGEDGPEGILPLKRGADGKLGVAASGAGGGVVNLSVTTVVNNDGSTKSQTNGNKDSLYGTVTEQMRTVAQEEVQKMMRPGGALWKAGVSTA